ERLPQFLALWPQIQTDASSAASPPRKRGSRATDESVALDPRFRGGDNSEGGYASEIPLVLDPPITAPAEYAAREWSSDEALVEIVRGRLEGLGPVTEAALAAPLGLRTGDVAIPLAALQVEGFALRGRFTSGIAVDEWCERRLLARVHTYTVQR